MQLPTAYITALDGVTRELASARPDAPVVPHVEPVGRTRALRLALSRGLLWAARAAAPGDLRSPASLGLPLTR